MNPRAIPSLRSPWLSFPLWAIGALAESAQQPLDEVNVALQRCGASARASSVFGPGYGADNVLDGEWELREEDKWNSARGAGPHWLVIDLGAERTVHRLVIRHEGVLAEGERYDTRDFQLQRGESADGPWTDVVPPITDNAQHVTAHDFPPTPLRWLRLYVTRGEAAGNDFARVFEIEAYARAATLPAALRAAAAAPEAVDFPATFRDGTIHLFSSSHQDIAWMDSIERCVEQRDLQVITPALEKMRRDPSYRFAMEDVLALMEYLERHPERRDEVLERTREGRLEWGATYNQPYESLWAGESLVRQAYLGRKWLKRTLPGCDSITAWNPDVPGRALQMPQILAKAGIEYLILSRHEQGFYRWKSPDGSSVLAWSPGHYYDQHSILSGSAPRAARRLAAAMRRAEPYWREHALPPAFPCYISTDASGPAEYPELMRDWPALAGAPRLEYSTGTRFLQAVAAARPQLPELCGERPNVWLYIHGPTHHWAVSALRDAARLLPAAEAFSTLEALLCGDFAGYPSAELERGWRAHLYPDHGWGGYYGELTDQTFLEKELEARTLGEQLVEQATTAIARRVRTSAERGLPIVVFNPLSWPRSDPVVCALPSDWPVSIVDAQGRSIPAQPLGGRRITFVARAVPGLGYATFYARPATAEPPAFAPRPATVCENDFFRIQLGGGGIAELFDKRLGRRILRPGKFLGGELFTMQSVGNGAGEFAQVQQPTMEMFQRVASWSPPWTQVEDGPVRAVFELSLPQSEQKLRHVSLRERLIVYRELPRIDLELDLIGWDGAPWREFRLAFPVDVEPGRVTYSVPMGVVEVGQDEIAGAAGERYVEPCKDVRPREVQDWIDASGESFGLTLASSVAVCDYLDPTPDPLGCPLLQPVLLASRKSCHDWGNFYLQAGDHSYRFSLLPHAGGRQNGWRAAVQANNPLVVVVAPLARADATLPPQQSFCQLGAGDLIVSALKKCDDDASVILRCWNIAERDQRAALSFFQPLAGVERTDLIEERGAPLDVAGEPLLLEIGHHAIETFKLHLQSRAR